MPRRVKQVEAGKTPVRIEERRELVVPKEKSATAGEKPASGRSGLAGLACVQFRMLRS